MRNLNPVGIILTLALVGLLFIVMEVVKIQGRINYKIYQGDDRYNATKVDSVRGNTIYFKDLEGNSVSVNGSYTVKTFTK